MPVRPMLLALLMAAAALAASACADRELHLHSIGYGSEYHSGGHD